VVAPEVAFVCIVPGLAAAFAVLLMPRSHFLALALVLMATVLTCGQLFEWAWGFFLTVGASFPAILAPFSTLTAVTLLPMLARVADRRIGLALVGTCCLLGSSLLVFFVVEDAPEMSRPALTHALFVADTDSRQFYNASADRSMSSWSRAVLGSEAKLTDLRPLFQRPMWKAAAMAVHSRPPILEFNENGMGSGLAVQLSVTVGPSNGGRQLRLLIRPSVDLERARLNGQLIQNRIPGNQWWELSYVAPADRLQLSFEAAQPGRIEVYAAEIVDGWPNGLHVPPKPPQLMAWYDSDTTVVYRRGTLKW